MTSWLTIKESECMEIDNEDIDEEDNIGEIGILKLRSNYTQGLSALHVSASAGDESWIKSRHCFEEIILLTKQTTEETAAARTECILILFLAYSNLSRMLVYSDKKLALFYAIEAASVMNINDTSIHDPGLLLRIAKLTLSNNDFWSCKQIIAYNLGQNDINGGLEESFHQLREDLNEQEQHYYNSTPSTIFNKKILVKGKILSLQIKRQVPVTTSNPISDSPLSTSSKSFLNNQFSTFNKLTILLDSEDQNSLSDYSLELCTSDSSTNNVEREIEESALVSNTTGALNKKVQNGMLRNVMDLSVSNPSTASPIVVSIPNLANDSMVISHSATSNSAIVSSFPLDTTDTVSIPNTESALPHKDTCIDVNKVEVSTAQSESTLTQIDGVIAIDLDDATITSNKPLSVDIRKGRSAGNDSKISNDSTGEKF